MSLNRRLAGDAWEALFRAQVVLMRGFTASDVWGSLSTNEYDVLFTLSRGTAEGMRQSDIVQMQLIGQSSLSRLIDRLETRGLVQRVTDPADARCTLVQLTEDGRDTQRAIGARHLEDITRALESRLDSAELQQLQQLCTKLIESNRTTSERTAP